jgi:hypothetical protein
MKRILSSTIFTQGIYYLITGVWPLVDIHSFMLVTGPKTDIWLVKAMSCLFCAIGLALVIGRKERVCVWLSLLTSFSMAVIDFYYSSIDVTSDVYKIDGVIQVLFFIPIVLSISGPRKPD